MPGARSKQGGEDLDQGGFPGAVWTQQAEKLAWADFQVNIIQGK